MAKPIRYVLFDAANTLIHKADLWDKLGEVFTKHQYKISRKELKYKHKMISELIHFPDATSKTFYNEFNAELCRLLGVVPNTELLNDIFENCKYLPWKAFEDVKYLVEIDTPIGVLSNFNKGLTKILEEKLPTIKFKNIIISEEEGVAKPNMAFYKRAIEIIGLKPEEILYIGDSVKLDLEPALAVGFQVRLIDRECFFKASEFHLKSLKNI